jgi:hypothetical protein
MIWVEQDLGDSLTIAQINEDEVPQVTAAGHPAHQQDILPGVLRCQNAAHVCAF